MYIKMRTEIKNQKKVPGVKTASFMGNTGSLYLNIKVVKDGSVVHQQRGKSFVANFARLIASMMQTPPVDHDLVLPTDTGAAQLNRSKFDACLRGILVDGGGTLAQVPRAREPIIDSITEWNVADDPERVRIAHGGSPIYGNLYEHGERVHIFTGDHKGTYAIGESFASGSTAQRVIKLTGLNATGSEPNAECRSIFIINPARGHFSYIGASGRIELGRSDTPTAIDDQVIIDPFKDSELTPSAATSVTPPVIAANTARISVSSTFTNATGSIQTIREIGLNLRHTVDNNSTTQSEHILKLDRTVHTTNPHTQILCARDVLDTPIEASIGETFTIIYEILCNADAVTGTVVNENFADMLYRQMAQTSRACRDYFNNSHTVSSVWYPFRVYSDTTNRYGSFNNQTVYPLDRNVFNLGLHGIVLGSESEPVDIDDVYLRDSLGEDVTIPNGSHSGALIYHPTFYTDFEMDSGKAVAVFTRFVENKSGAPITVKQLGLTVASGSIVTRPALIARTNLAEVDWFTIADGAFYKIEYKVGVGLSP